MRVLIVNKSSRTGGAAVAASRLMQALINSGVKAKMLVADKDAENINVVEMTGSYTKLFAFLWERFCIWTSNLFSLRNLFKVSIANSGLDITKTKEFQEADIIHLHWINQGLLSLRGIDKILKSGKPIVWTMHDMWPLTSICHHAYKCEKYTTECKKCIFLRFPSNHDLSYKVFHRKQKYFQSRNIKFVAVSNWLADKAKHSAIIGNESISVVPNVISLSNFPVRNRDNVRKEMGLNAKFVAVFGAARLDDEIKGLPYLIAALKRLKDMGKLTDDNFCLLLFGRIKNKRILDTIPLPFSYLDYLNDESELSRIYSASNCLVSPSLYETFGQTLVEAMACGCLPVAFGNSGQCDFVKHLENGYLADNLSVESLADGIMWAMENKKDINELRAFVHQHFSESVVARRYIDVYNDALKNTNYYDI